MNSLEGVRAFPKKLTKICPFVRLSVCPHGITLGVYKRIHFWDALLIKLVKIVCLELVWNYPRLNFLDFFFSKRCQF
jgi:hypothetical protein